MFLKREPTMTRPTVKTLATNLVKIGFISTPFTISDLKNHKVRGVGNETYGRNSHVYIYTTGPDARRSLEASLVSAGIPVSTSYSPSGSTVDVPVSFFKGDRWDE